MLDLEAIKKRQQQANEEGGGMLHLPPTYTKINWPGAYDMDVDDLLAEVERLTADRRTTQAEAFRAVARWCNDFVCYGSLAKMFEHWAAELEKPQLLMPPTRPLPSSRADVPMYPGGARYDEEGNGPAAY